MVIEIKKYTLTCDKCKFDYWDDNTDLDFLEECAVDQGWVKHQKEHFCPDCHTYDENLDLNV
jgi:hypothetical protein